MSNINQFMSSGGSQIGDPLFYPDSGTFITRTDSSKFLRSGTVALSSLYPLAAKVESLMVHGTGVKNLPVTNNVKSFATDGNSTIVMCYGDSTNVMVSTDKGNTFSLVPHNAGVPVTSAIYNGSRFILAGVSGSTLKCSYSATGASFTAGGTTTVSDAAQGISMAWDGNIAVIATFSGANTTSTITTTTDGTSLVQKSIPIQTYGSNAKIICNPAAGANRWLLVSIVSTVAARSTAADASTWESVTPPVVPICASAGLGTFVIANASNFYTSTNGATGSWTVLPSQGIASGSVGSTAYISGSFGIIDDQSIQFDGSRFLIGSASRVSSTSAQQFAYTTDFKNFTLRQIIPQTVMVDIGAYWSVVPVGTNLLLLNKSTSTPSSAYIYATNWFTSSEYVGSSAPFYAAIVTNMLSTPQRTLYGYVRVV